MKQRYWILLAVALFLAFSFFMEGRGYFIHKVSYDRGASYTASDLQFDNAVALAMYQIVIIALIPMHKNFWVWLGTETFWWTCTQDLIFFFGVWNAGVFPVGDWAWMPNYQAFGAWTTTMQVAWSVGLLGLVACIAYAATKIKLPKN